MTGKRYVIIGGGAIGGALAAQLVPAGFEVVLIARGEHGKRIATDGLTVQRPTGTEIIRVSVAAGPDEIRLGLKDVLLLAVKTQDSEAALAEWAWQPVHDRAGVVIGAAATHLPIVTLQNGLATEDLALRRFDRVLGATIGSRPATPPRARSSRPRSTRPALVWIGAHPDGPDSLAGRDRCRLRQLGHRRVLRS